MLHELFENANNYITDENYTKALVLLSKSSTLLQAINIHKNHKNASLLLGTYHNIALCYQRMGSLSQCADALQKCLQMSEDLKACATQFSNGFQRTKYLCRTHMQLCAIQSQLRSHEDAQKSALISAQYSHLLIHKFFSYCKSITQKIDCKKQKVSEYDNYNSNASPLSLFEISSIRLLPLIEVLSSKLIPESCIKREEEVSKDALHKIDLKNLFGYLNNAEWISNVNIGSIMQLSQFSVQDIYSSVKEELELSRESIVDKICLVVCSYFCVATEKRFLSQFYEQCEDTISSSSLSKES